MVALAVILALAALLAAVLACSVRLNVKYDDSGAGLTVRVACFRALSIPGNGEKKNTGAKKEKKEKLSEPKVKKPGGKKNSLQTLKKNRHVLIYALKKLARLPGKTVLRKLRVCCSIGGLDDPFRAAMMSAGGFAAQSAVRALLDSTFSKVRDYSFAAQVDFFSSETLFEAEGEISLRIWHIVALAVSCAVAFFKNMVCKCV